MLVIDASVAVKWFLDEPLRAEARHILQHRRDTAAPDFILVELANAGGPDGALVTADKRFFAKVKDSRHADRILFLTDPAL